MALNVATANDVSNEANRPLLAHLRHADAR